MTVKLKDIAYLLKKKVDLDTIVLLIQQDEGCSYAYAAHKALRSIDLIDKEIDDLKELADNAEHDLNVMIEYELRKN